MRTVLNKPLLYSAVHTLAIALFATIASVNASNAVFTADIDLRFIGPVAVFLMFLSLIVTYLPMTLLRAASIKKFLHLKKAPYIAAVIEILFFGFSLLGYISSMSGDNLGGVALLIITFVNLVLVVAFGIIYGLVQLFDKSRPKIIELKTRAIHENSQPTIVQSSLNDCQ